MCAKVFTYAESVPKPLGAKMKIKIDSKFVALYAAEYVFQSDLNTLEGARHAQEICDAGDNGWDESSIHEFNICVRAIRAFQNAR